MTQKVESSSSESESDDSSDDSSEEEPVKKVRRLALDIILKWIFHDMALFCGDNLRGRRTGSSS